MSTEKYNGSDDHTEKGLTLIQRPPSRIANAAPAYVSSFSLLTWHTFIKFLLVGYSLSHLPHFYYPCTTSMHVGFIRQMSSLVWLYSLVVSCNSLQECGSSQGATYLELQVNWKTSGFIFFRLYLLFLKKGVQCHLSILNNFFCKKRVTVSDSLNLSFRFFRLFLDVLFRHPHPRDRSLSCILWPTRTLKRYWIIPHSLVHVYCNARVRIFFLLFFDDFRDISLIVIALLRSHSPPIPN